MAHAGSRRGALLSIGGDYVETGEGFFHTDQRSDERVSPRLTDKPGMLSPLFLAARSVSTEQ